jgi:hypothetical protein
LVNKAFEQLVSDKSLIETFNFLSSHAIRYDQQNKERAARQIDRIHQSSNATNRDEVKKVLALIQDSGG